MAYGPLEPGCVFEDEAKDRRSSTDEKSSAALPRRESLEGQAYSAKTKEACRKG